MMKKRTKMISISFIVFFIIAGGITGFSIWRTKQEETARRNFIPSYMTAVKEKRYEDMYQMLDKTSKEKITKEDFIARNENIYEGIELTDLTVQVGEVKEIEGNKITASYESDLTTCAGEVTFSNTAVMVKEEKEYKLSWSSKIIFPQLLDTDKVKVKNLTSKRGSILDRNDQVLAGEGTVSAIGFVPGKMGQDKEAGIKKVAEILGMTEESIQKQLTASYVKDDTFVQLKRVQNKEQSLIDQVLTVPGIKVMDSKARVYPYGAATSHLTGYVQSVNAEELETLKGKGYHQNSLVGKAGLEKVYEDRLRGLDGSEIDIVDAEGEIKQILAKQDLKDGENIKTTIDAALQAKVYEKMKTEQGVFVIMQPKTGEMLSLISTPSYDANDFIIGLSSEKWNELNNDAATPLLNRYLATWSPGSTFKPITGAIGLTTGKLDANQDFGHSGLSYQKDKSWGDYKITTLREYSGSANLLNALKYSDNIYFGKAAITIGGETLAEGFNKIGFNEVIPFAQNISKSTYAQDSTFQSEIQLADSGYGQGQVLVNPIHMASIYSAFVNDGNMIQPYLEYKEDKTPTILKKEAFSKEAASTIRDDLVQVIESPGATAHSIQNKGVTYAAKTGTAELKADKKEQNGAELSWLNAFSVDPKAAKQYLVVSMRKIYKNDDSGASLFPIVKSLFQ